MNRVVDPASAAAAAAAPPPEAGTADSGGGTKRRRRDEGEEDDEQQRGLERVHASAPTAAAVAPRLLLPATSNNHNHCSSTTTTSWMLLPFEADQDQLTIKYDGEVFWKAGDLADVEANEFDGYFARTPAEFLTTKEEEGGTIIDIGAFQRIIRDGGGDEGSAAYVAAVVNLCRPPMADVRR
jgi:hypothetical protein